MTFSKENKKSKILKPYLPFHSHQKLILRPSLGYSELVSIPTRHGPSGFLSKALIMW